MKRAQAGILVLSLAFMWGQVGCECPQKTEQSPANATVKSSNEVEGVAETQEPQLKTLVIEGPALKDGKEAVVTHYRTVPPDSVLEEIREETKAKERSAEEATDAIRERQVAEKEVRKKERLRLKAELPEAARPSSLDQFEVIPHLPPVPQYMTGTCWSFAGTSFLENEVIRLHGKEIKLSEMHSVYYEYLAKAERYAAERSASVFGEGSEGNAVPRMVEKYGAVPVDAFLGVHQADDRHNHMALYDELEALLFHRSDAELWDTETVRGMFQVVLNRHLGTPPTSFEYEGAEYTPKRFLDEVMGVATNDYVSFMSTMKTPFYTRGVFDVPDNWWRDDTYHNLPLEPFYEAFKAALKAGFSVVVAIDVSEPGKSSDTDTMFIPAFDIPSGSIDQLSREYRINNRTTTDDHAVSIVGVATLDGRDWFLAKDSGRGSRRGKHEGYYFVRDDYVRLKVLGFTVHKDAVKDQLAKF